MREFRIFYSVLVVLLTVMCFVYQSRIMPMLLLILIICPVLSFIVMLVNFFTVRLRVAPTEIITHKLEECVIVLTLENRFIFPVSPIRIIGDFPNAEIAESGDFSKKILMADVSPMSEVKLNIPFRFTFRGEYIIKIYEIQVFDLLRIFKLKHKLGIAIRIGVLPRDKTARDSGRETDSEVESPTSKITFNKSNIFNSLREYREGDNIRNIHWKLSAKSDELIVKQMEQSVNNSAVIFCDYSSDFKKEDDDNEGRFLTRRMLDAVLETSLAVTSTILDEGSSVINCWHGPRGSEKYELIEFAHYSYLYGVFTVLPQEPAQKSFEELITLFAPETKGQHFVYLITPRITRKLLDCLEETGLTVADNVSLITFTVTNKDNELSDFISENTKIKIIEINDDNAQFTINGS